MKKITGLKSSVLKDSMALNDTIMTVRQKGRVTREVYEDDDESEKKRTIMNSQE